MIVMPTAKRPEMLALALEKISLANNPDEVHILADTDANLADIEFVRDSYLPEATILHAKPHVHTLSGTWNILRALEHGFKFSETNHIFLIEEDVLVGKNFFDWHRQNLTSNLFATCGRSHKSQKYTNPGACFHPRSTALLMRHVSDKFFEDPMDYMSQEFPGTTDASSHDDGLIRRMITSYGMKVAWPEKPICAHIGFRAYNRYDGWTNNGNIQSRIANLRQMIAKMDSRNRFTTDWESIV